jgi:acetyl esterase/lipase
MYLRLGSAWWLQLFFFEARIIARKLPDQLAAAYGRSHLPDNFPQFPLDYGELWQFHRDPTVIEKKLTFLSRDGSSLPLIVYQKGDTGPRPCILVVHGGGWDTGDASQLPGLSRWLASKGYLVASVGYRLAPKFQWPAQKEDVIAALAYLKSNAAALGISPNKFVVLGRSAGGQIALATAYELHDPAIRGCVDLYAPTDMNFAYRFGKEDDILKSRGLVRAFMGGTPDDRPGAYNEASALDQVGPDTPPTLIVQGTRDELVWIRHSQRLNEKLLQAGRPVCFLEMPWATHAFDYSLYGPGGQLMRYALSWFLDQVLS